MTKEGKTLMQVFGFEKDEESDILYVDIGVKVYKGVDEIKFNMKISKEDEEEVIKWV